MKSPDILLLSNLFKKILIATISATSFLLVVLGYEKRVFHRSSLFEWNLNLMIFPLLNFNNP